MKQEYCSKKLYNVINNFLPAYTKKLSINDEILSFSI
jgi:hypothetical protein